MELAGIISFLLLLIGGILAIGLTGAILFFAWLGFTLWSAISKIGNFK